MKGDGDVRKMDNESFHQLYTTITKRKSKTRRTDTRSSAFGIVQMH